VHTVIIPKEQSAQTQAVLDLIRAPKVAEGEATMASSLVKLGTIKNLAPAQSVTKHWNNATPANAVWYIQAIPLPSSFTSANPIEQSVEAEVTRVWRKLNRTIGPAENPEAYYYEDEIWYVIRNVGAREVDVDVYASIIS
jgi:hypothetical protein